MPNFADWCCQLLAGRVFDRKPRCTLHDVVERGVYPYRCSRCGECFVCRHFLFFDEVGERHYWLCRDGSGGRVPTTPSPGVPEAV